jgi:hypothetical protein
VNRKSKKPVSWSEIGVLALLASLVIIGLAANSASQPVGAIVFGAGIFLLAWLGQLTRRKVQSSAALTGRQWVFNAVVFLTWLATMAAVVWWCVADRSQ